jgi:hypothetical protein
MKMNEGWGLGRGELRRVRTNMTTMTTWAEDGDGKGNNNARSALSELFPAARYSIFVLSQCPSELHSSPSVWRADDNGMPVAATRIPRRMANGCTEVMKTVGIRGVQSLSLGGRGRGGKGGGGRFGLTVGVAAVVVVVV